MALDPQYVIAPSLEMYFVDKTAGLPLAGGQVFFYSDVNRSALKPIFTISGTAPNYDYVQLPNPSTLSGVGTFQDAGNNNILPYYFPYDADGNIELYYIEVFDSNGVLQFTREAWPNLTTQSSPSGESLFNIVRNPQFARWGTNASVLSGATSAQDYVNLGANEVIADDFFFSRNNTNATVSISQQSFVPGQILVPANPISYLNYECTNIGSGGESTKAILQRYQSAQFLSGVEVSVGFWGMTSLGGGETVTVSLNQNFGSGGSPSAIVITQVLTANLTSTWNQFTGTVVIPSVSGKSFGINGDDYLGLNINLPLNAISDLNIANLQMCAIDTLPPIANISVDDQIKQMDSITNYGTFRTGMHVITLATDLGFGWIQCNDGTIGAVTSNATTTGNYLLPLYILLWGSVSNTYAPTLNSAGTPVARGASAVADWNANKRLTLTQTLGRVLGASGTGPGPATFALGQTAGEQQHTLTTGEVPANSGNFTVNTGIITGSPQSPPYLVVTNAVAGVGPNTVGLFYDTVDTDNHMMQNVPVAVPGGGGPHNNIQPSIFLNCFIKW